MPKRSSSWLKRVLSVLFVMTAMLPVMPSRADQTGKAAPDWQLSDVNGKPLKLADFKGKVVVLDFWATWCPPCRAEIPGLVAIQKKYANQGLSIIGISLDEQGPTVVKPFIDRFAINYPVVMGNEKVLTDYGGISAIPTTFVIDREGNVVAAHEGYTDQATFESEIKPLLAAGARS
ncbi:MAG: redoxin domain-containing protein [Verrucomicrobia bacterium]|nr:redoxin domain-containing protein [Verrucomicrobiota bacterium]